MRTHVLFSIIVIDVRPRSVPKISGVLYNGSKYIYTYNTYNTRDRGETTPNDSADFPQ